VIRNEKTGAVRVAVAVQEGLPTIVRSVAVEVLKDNQEPLEACRT
jgi:hypothetical protein